MFFFRPYLRWAYKRGIKDVEMLSVKPNFTKNTFSCLLCGVAGEVTAEEFIKFVFSKNPKAQITIIDMGTEQIAAVKKIVDEKYKNYAIKIKQMNALDLTKKFKPNSFDWIETDGFIEYFDKKSLEELLHQWKLLLKKDGFITTRDFASIPPFGFLVDGIRYWFIKKYLTLSGYIHTKKDLQTLFTENDFRFVHGLTPIPTYRRFALVLK